MEVINEIPKFIGEIKNYEVHINTFFQIEIYKKYFIDEDNNEIYIEVVALNNLGIEEPLPNWLSFDNYTNILNGIPNLLTNYTIIVKFNDSYSA